MVVDVSEPERQLVRPTVHAVVLHGDRLLVRRSSDAPEGTGYAFIGGQCAPGETFETRLRQAIDEQTSTRLVQSEYLFVVEHFFTEADQPAHAVEHYLWASVDRVAVSGRTPGHDYEWLPLATLAESDLAPHPVRDLIAAGRHRDPRHLVVRDGELA